jgi:hypothetical protein
MFLLATKTTSIFGDYPANCAIRTCTEQVHILGRSVIKANKAHLSSTKVKLSLYTINAITIVILPKGIFILLIINYVNEPLLRTG